MFFQIRFQRPVQMMEPGEQFSVVGIMDQENLVQVPFDFCHVIPFTDMVRRFQVLEHVRNGKTFKPFQRFLLAAGLSTVFGKVIIQIGYHFFCIQIGSLYRFFQRNSPATAVIQVKKKKKGNRLGIIPYHFGQRIFYCNHKTFLLVRLMA